MNQPYSTDFNGLAFIIISKETGKKSDGV